MENEVYEFDAPPESVALKNLPTVDKVGFQHTVKPESSPLAVNKRDLLVDEVYTLFSRGYSAQNIAKRTDTPLTEVHRIINEERVARANTRKEAGFMSLEDSITFYNHIKTEAMERAKYSDEKFAPAFIKEAKEAQIAIDRLLGAAIALEPNKLDPLDQEGLVIYRERKVITEAEMPNVTPIPGKEDK